MTFLLKDRVKETTTTTGTGTVTLAGAATGFQSFSAIGNGNTCAYTIAAGTEWEVGIGTYTTAGTTLSRDTVLASSNSGSLVSFSAGSKDVFVTVPAGLIGWLQIGATSTPSGVASVTFSSIPSYYQDLKLEFIGLSPSANTPQLKIELSGNNGGSWTGVQSVSGTVSGASGGIYGAALIPDYRGAAGGVIGWGADLSSADVTSGSAALNSDWRIAAGINAIRLTWSGAENFDAGSVKLKGR